MYLLPCGLPGLFKQPLLDSKSSAGLSPQIPQKCAGTLTEPPASAPKDRGDKLDATATEEPPELPPATRDKSKGLLVCPFQ